MVAVVGIRAVWVACVYICMDVRVFLMPKGIWTRARRKAETREGGHVPRPKPNIKEVEEKEKGGGGGEGEHVRP